MRMWRFNAGTSSFDCMDLKGLGHVRAITAIAVFQGLQPGNLTRVYTGSEDRTVKVFDLNTMQCTNTVMPPAPAGGAAAAPAAATGGFGRIAHAAVSAATGGAVAGAGSGSTAGYEIVALDTLTLGGIPLLFVGHENGAVRLFILSNPDKPELSPAPTHHIPPDTSGRKLTSMAVMELDSAPDNPVLLTGYDNGSIVVRDIVSGIASPALILHNLVAGDKKSHAGAVTHLNVPDGKHFVSASVDGKMLVWELTLEDETAAGAVAVGAAAIPGNVGVVPGPGGYR